MSLQSEEVVQLLLKHRGKLIASIRAMVVDEHLAEDIFQEVSIAAYHKCSEIEAVESFGAWVRSAARLQSLVALRNRNRLPRVLSEEVLDLLESHWTLRDDSSDTDRSRVLKECLSGISPYARELLNARYIRGNSGERLAKEMGRSLNTVYVALSRVHATLRKCVSRELARAVDGRGA